MYTGLIVSTASYPFVSQATQPYDSIWDNDQPSAAFVRLPQLCMRTYVRQVWWDLDRTNETEFASKFGVL